MNISLNEITEKRNQILNNQNIYHENKPRKRSVTEINANYLDIVDNETIVETNVSPINSNTNSNPNSNPNSNYMMYINKKLGLITSKLNLVDTNNDTNRRNFKLFLLLIFVFIMLIVINDYLAITYTSISLN